MTIRTRLTLWYAGVLFTSLVAISSLAYYELVVEPRKRAGRQHAEQPYDFDKGAFKEIAEIALWCGVPAALLGLAGGWLLIRKALQPVRELTLAASTMNEGLLKKRLPRSGNGDEIDRLGAVFNEMTARLDDSFRRVHEFTLYASHEMKTPLTILRGELESALRDEGLNPAQRDRIASQIEEVQRLARIVNGLTFLAKVNAGQASFQKEILRFDELVREAYADTLVLALPKGVQVTLAECEEAWIRGDRHRLRQLLLNLTDNAVKYNRPQGQVTLAVRRVEEHVVLTVSNTGPGVPRELQARVFEPFFRGELVRGETVEGSGLGLSICRLIAQLHDGRIAFDSHPGVRTDVTVVMPLAEHGMQPQAVSGAVGGLRLELDTATSHKGTSRKFV